MERVNEVGLFCEDLLFGYAKCESINIIILNTYDNSLIFDLELCLQMKVLAILLVSMLFVAGKTQITSNQFYK